MRRNDPLSKIVFIAADGARREVQGNAGTSVMSAARANGVVGIEAECAGSLSCGTCHVYVAPEFLSRLPAPSEQEAEMLEFVAAERRESSRLSCQIVFTDDLDGLTLEIPETQS
jgi:2Fe-2S ferredoxin